MKENKLETILNLFEGSEIRSILDTEKEEYYFSIVDVISALINAKIPRNYWNDLKRKLVAEESKLHEKIVQLKIETKDGKLRITDINIEELSKLWYSEARFNCLEITK